jgi:hypothetical protein
MWEKVLCLQQTLNYEMMKLNEYLRLWSVLEMPNYWACLH